jgi:hypothetical protein
MRTALALALLLAGCREAGNEAGNQGVNISEIERLSTPKVEVVDRNALARVQPLEAADLEREGLAHPSCNFTRDGRVLFAATAEDAIARIGGTLRHFAHSSPVGPTGGFFEDRQVSVSVGRVAGLPLAEAAAGSWPARIIVTNRRAEAQVEINGLWSCRGGT